MTCAMETIATDAVFLIILIWKGIHVCFSGHRLMESRVEHCNLRRFGHQLCHRFDTGYVGWIMQGCHRVAFFYFFDNFRSDEHGFVEIFHSMHHAVTNSTDFVEALYHPLLRIRKNLHHLFDCLLVVGHFNCYSLF